MDMTRITSSSNSSPAPAKQFKFDSIDKFTVIGAMFRICYMRRIKKYCNGEGLRLSTEDAISKFYDLNPGIKKMADKVPWASPSVLANKLHV